MSDHRMTDRIRTYLSDLREGARILTTRTFWRAFRDYWSAPSITARLDAWTSRHRDRTGQDPDWDVEHRIAKRRADNLNDKQDP